MKSSIKKITVCLSKDNITEHIIDVTEHSDPFFEAITRAIEAGNTVKNVLIHIRPIATCWETKNPKKMYSYNSYFPMINAGQHVRAELLREKFNFQNDIDLAKEPIGGLVS
jgi:hypothetical protein